jgi:hypothetical protein
MNIDRAKAMKRAAEVQGRPLTPQEEAGTQQFLDSLQVIDATAKSLVGTLHASDELLASCISTIATAAGAEPTGPFAESLRTTRQSLEKLREILRAERSTFAIFAYGTGHETQSTTTEENHHARHLAS